MVKRSGETGISAPLSTTPQKALVADTAFDDYTACFGK